MSNNPSIAAEKKIAERICQRGELSPATAELRQVAALESIADDLTRLVGTQQGMLAAVALIQHALQQKQR